MSDASAGLNPPTSSSAGDGGRCEESRVMPDAADTSQADHPPVAEVAAAFMREYADVFEVLAR